MLLETLKDGLRRIEELLELAEQLPVMQPADLARLKSTQVALEAVVKIETLKQTMLKELGQS